MVNRIALISYHNELNYGTMLQAYALYRALKMQGVDSEYITYQSSAPSLKRHLLQCLNRYLFHPKNLYDRVVRRKGSQDDFSFLKQMNLEPLLMLLTMVRRIYSSYKMHFYRKKYSYYI